MAIDTVDTELPRAVAKDLNALRVIFLDRVWLGLLIVTTVAVPLSLLRIFFTDFQPAFVVQFLMLAVLGAGFMLREHMSFIGRAIIVIGLLDFNGIASVMSFGLFGASWWWLFMSSLLVALCFRTRAGLYHAIVAIVLLIVVALGFVQGTLSLDFDANAYSRQFLPWASLLTGPVLFTVFVFWACDAFLKAVSEIARKAL